jgi:hypothetical protein
MPRAKPIPYIDPDRPCDHEASVLPRINPPPTCVPTKVPRRRGQRMALPARKKSFSFVEAKRLAPIEIASTIIKGMRNIPISTWIFELKTKR